MIPWPSSVLYSFTIQACIRLHVNVLWVLLYENFYSRWNYLTRNKYTTLTPKFIEINMQLFALNIYSYIWWLSGAVCPKAPPTHWSRAVDKSKISFSLCEWDMIISSSNKFCWDTDTYIPQTMFSLKKT